MSLMPFPQVIVAVLHVRGRSPTVIAHVRYRIFAKSLVLVPDERKLLLMLP